MNGPGPRPAPVARRLRGTVLVGFTVLLAAVGHLAGGGTAPDLALLLALVPLAWPVVAVADRCRGPLSSTAVLATGQLVLHQVLSMGPGHHDEATALAHGAAHPALHGGPEMLVMHGVATVLAVLALRHADRALDAFGAALRRVLPPRPTGAPVVAGPRTGPVVPRPAGATRIRRALAVAHARRGPPVCC